MLGYALAQPGDLLGHRAEPFILLFLLLFLALPGLLTTSKVSKVDSWEERVGVSLFPSWLGSYRWGSLTSLFLSERS